MAGRTQGRESGFTAIELMVVIGIIIIIAALTIPTIAGLMRSTRLASSTNTCAAMIRTARALAIASSEIYCFELDDSGDPALVGVYDDFAAPPTYPKGRPNSEARLESDIAVSSPDGARLEFQPDGSARLDGQTVPIATYTVELAEEGGRTRRIRVKGLTGMVSITASGE